MIKWLRNTWESGRFPQFDDSLPIFFVWHLWVFPGKIKGGSRKMVFSERPISGWLFKIFQIWDLVIQGAYLCLLLSTNALNAKKNLRSWFLVTPKSTVPIVVALTSKNSFPYLGLKAEMDFQALLHQMIVQAAPLPVAVAASNAWTSKKGLFTPGG